MTATPVSKPPAAALTPLGAEVYRGLSARPKTLSPWLLYDAAGSRLFEAICALPEYYLTRTERAILGAHANEIVDLAAAGDRLSIVELGAGAATKTGLLLRAAIKRQGHAFYRPIDVSASALADAKRRLETELANLTVEPVTADYTDGLEEIPRAGVEGERRLVLYIGSSIGNFDPAEAQSVLRGLRARLAPGDALLLGVDMVKDPRLLLAAYDDPRGVTAAFNRNLLRRLNRELDANFDLALFHHRARWNEAQSRIEMHLESGAAQRVAIPALEMEARFFTGETIHTENSYKFTDFGVRRLLRQSGFMAERSWRDAQGWFAVYLARNYASTRP